MYSALSLPSTFDRPIIIYDDKCYSCTKFAKVACTLSRGWVRTVGHYYSEEAQRVKELIFPKEYDATHMFWLVNRSGAHGARTGLLPLAKEIVRGWFLKEGMMNSNNGGKNDDLSAPQCNYLGTSMSCYTPTSIFRRLVTMLSHGASFSFPPSPPSFSSSQSS
jgi:hypothetical protein